MSVLITRAYPDVIVVDQAGAELPVSVDLGSNAPVETSTPTEPNFESDLTNPPFLLPHPNVNDNSEFFSDGFTYHPSETSAAHSPLHIARHELDPKATSVLDPIPPDDPNPQPAADMPTCSTRSESDLSSDPLLPHLRPTPLSLRISPCSRRNKSVPSPSWWYLSYHTTRQYAQFDTRVT